MSLGRVARSTHVKGARAERQPLTLGQHRFAAPLARLVQQVQGRIHADLEGAFLGGRYPHESREESGRTLKAV